MKVIVAVYTDRNVRGQLERRVREDEDISRSTGKQEDFREHRASGTISFIEELELLPYFMF